jgi:hypothetical protein
MFLFHKLFKLINKKGCILKLFQMGSSKLDRLWPRVRCAINARIRYLNWQRIRMQLLDAQQQLQNAQQQIQNAQRQIQGATLDGTQTVDGSSEQVSEVQPSAPSALNRSNSF